MSQSSSKTSTSEYLWTLIPLFAAVFIVVAYIAANRALITCEQGGNVCDPADIGPLLVEKGWCAGEADKRGFINDLRRPKVQGAAGARSSAASQTTAQTSTPATSPSPAPEQMPSPTLMPTPSVKVPAEAEAPAQQVTVQVKLPPVAPAPTPEATTLEERRVAVYSARLPWLLLYAIAALTNFFALFPALYIFWSSLSMFGPSGKAWTLAAILAPLLVGSVGDLLKMLGSV